MSGPRPLVNYPKSYFDLFWSLATEKERVITDLVSPEVQRKDLYNFRAALGLAGIHGDRDAARLNLLSQSFTFRIKGTTLHIVNRTLTDPFRKRVSGTSNGQAEAQAQPHTPRNPTRDV